MRGLGKRCGKHYGVRLFKLEALRL